MRSKFESNGFAGNEDLDLGWMVVLIVDKMENFYQLQRSRVGAVVVATRWQEWLWS